jgi:heme a synthase
LVQPPRALHLPTLSPRAFLRVAQVNLGLVVLNIVSGGAVRLSDSGLGCPDWPNCSEHHFTPPLSIHPLIEFSNRMVVVALCIAAGCTVVGALRRAPFRRDLVLVSAGLVAGIIGEAGLGAVVVYSKLNPYAVMTHFMVGIGLLTVALVLVLRAGRAAGNGTAKVSLAEIRVSRLAVGVLLLAIVAGTATTASGPHAGGPGAKRLPVPLADMARTHSGIVLALGAIVLLLLYLLERSGTPESVRKRGRVLLAAMIAQGLIGYTQYFTHLPPLLVGVHIFGATVVWSAMYWFADGLRHHAPEEVLAGTSATELDPTEVSAAEPATAGAR